MNRTTLRFMVWNMRWMTRYIGFVARPIVRLYAAQEVIACGLREKSGDVSVIYTPWQGRKNHHAVVWEREMWKLSQMIPMENFSEVVLRNLLPNAHVGEKYRILAENSRGRSLHSPDITIKEHTTRDDTLMRVSAHTNGSVEFKWKDAHTHDPLIYFLVVEDERKNTHSAIYTREQFWVYPKIKRASLSVGPVVVPNLDSTKTYVAKLLLVDFDGWVSHIAQQKFSV